MGSAEITEFPNAAEAARHPILESVDKCIEDTAELAAEHQAEIEGIPFVIARSINDDLHLLPEGSIRRSYASRVESVGFVRDNEFYFLIIYGHDPDTGDPIAMADKIDPFDKWREANQEMIQGFVDQINLETRALRNGHLRTD